MSVPPHPQLFQLVMDGVTEVNLPDAAVPMHVPRMVPQGFAHAPADLRSELGETPGVLGVATVEYEPARFAVGFDQVLAAGRQAAVEQPNGWAQRAGQGNGIPRCPRVRDGGAGIEMDDTVEPTIVFDLASIVLAKEPPDPASEIAAADPVGIATTAAFEVGVTPILAAGNRGPDQGSLSGWAASPFVVAVGATSDAEGTTLDPQSARGTPDGRGPDLVAYAASALDDNERGTSYATPRVAREHATLITFANAALSVAARIAGRARGVPITSIGVVDWGEPTTPGAAAQLFGRNPASGIDPRAVEHTLSRMAALSVPIHLDPNRVRRAEVVGAWLRDTAVLVPGCAPHEAGRGFVRHEQTWTWCHRATGGHLATLLSEASADAALASDGVLAGIRIADPVTLPQAIDVWTSTTGLVYWEHEQQQLVIW